ncbi:Sterol O-acyltransferase 1 [Lamellibrachia satsuma]|nr:Sterol O-acyltransferase 1 [Lamellibrachia satsuma]
MDEVNVRRRVLGNGNIPNREQDHDSGPTQRHLDQQRLKNKALQLKTEMLDQFDAQLQDLVDNLMQEVDATLNPGKPFDSSLPGKSKKNMRGKEFFARPSVLTELLEISHIQTIYHIFVAILIVFSMNTIIYDLIDKGRPGLDFDLIIWSFGKFPIVMTMWSCMILSTLLCVYPVFYYWANNRTPGKATWVDYCWLGLYLAYQLAFLILPIQFLHKYSLRPASSVIIVTEQVRLLMKSHAFVRENIPQALRHRKSDGEDEEEKPLCPDFSKYLYFLFAPTLVYRNDYPRTSTVSWKYVVSNLTQVVACLFYIFYIFERFCVPVFCNFREEHISPKRILLSVFGSILPATLVLFIAFFAILHSWFNAFAEMLRFGDRLFYKDWWNSSSFANYYRTWNMVVHDWLYSYVYNDFSKAFGKPCRPLAMGFVFVLSAIFHEYILTICFGFFYPVLFVMFAGAGFMFMFVKNKDSPRSGNIFMWVGLFLGNGMLMCAYSMEWYARQTCPPKQDPFLDYIIPRSWTCDFAAMAQNTTHTTESLLLT